MTELTDRVQALEKENALLRERCNRVSEESNMEKFKCQLLVEMVRSCVFPKLSLAVRLQPATC